MVLAQSSGANSSGYGNTNAVTTPSDAQGGADPLSNDSTAASDVSTLSAAARVPNGGFNHWMRANQPGSSGNWFVYSGTTSPLSGHHIAAPPRGSYAATTDQDDPGSHVLYRNIRLKGGMKHRLSFFLYYHNFAGRFFTPRTLDYTVFPNQQYRVDVLRENANPFTVKRKAILATLFRTEKGDASGRGPTLLTFDLTRFAGKTVRLRFAEVDNQGYFLASVDRVRITSKRS